MNDTQLRNLKPREKSYRVSDGGGLYVQIEPSGGKLWRLAYRYHGKQKTLALGRYPEVGLSDDAIRGAYNAAEWLDGRRRMMNARGKNSLFVVS